MIAPTQRSKRATLHTLGCRLNQYETQVIACKLQAAGFTLVPFGEPADLGIINTCTVTQNADSKCRQTIRNFIRKNPQAITVVVGCYSQIGFKEIANIPGVDLIIGNQDKLNVLDYISDTKSEVPVIIRDRINRDDFSISFVGEMPCRQRANLKIQDGCNFMCSFCIITRSRGRARSRDFSNLMDEAEALVGHGVREFILTGVNIGTYRNRGNNILHVIDALDRLQANGLQRIRISSIEPTTIPNALFCRMADPSHALVPYLHIPLQSGSDKILQSMRRRYTLAEFLDFIRYAEQEVPHLCIGTDIMVGYPGETVKDFEHTCSVFLHNPFAYAHVFAYSERHSVPATRLPGTVSIPERHRRSSHLRRLSAKKRYDFYRQYRRAAATVLFENPSEGHWSGYTDNYIRVVARSADDLTNRLCSVRLDQINADHAEGTVLKILA